MRRELTLLVGLSFLLFSNAASAQDTISVEEEYEYRPFQFTFMCPPFSSNGPANGQIVNNTSINLFVGASGGVEGFEVGGFMNLDNYYVKGFQAAGFGNVVGGNVDGAQFAGFANVNRGSVRYVQGAGFINVTGGGQVGVQGAGFANVVGNGVYGVQGAGFGNFAGGDLSGVQAAGFINMANHADHSAQAAGFANVVLGGTAHVQAAGFINLADTVSGVQAAGFMNGARYVKGVQVAGFVNVCDSIDGVSIAPFPIVRHGGYRVFEIATTETEYLRASFRLGTEKFYTIYSLGKSYGPSTEFMTGAGFGTQLALGSTAHMNIEATTSHQFFIGDERAPFPIWWDRFNQHNQLRVLFGWELGEVASVFAGPSINISIANTSEYSGNFDWEPVQPNWAFYDRTLDTYREKNIAMWFGVSGGVRF